jgi:hypothetical protein
VRKTFATGFSLGVILSIPPQNQALRIGKTREESVTAGLRFNVCRCIFFTDIYAVRQKARHNPIARIELMRRRIQAARDRGDVPTVDVGEAKARLRACLEDIRREKS